ncbi:MAG: D-alanine--D-alanine ligase [Castellaniella sp.]
MKSSFGRVGVLYGGLSAEREVSLMSGRGVCEALRSKGVDAHLFDTGEHALCALADAGFDRVFIALHGRYGEDGSIQGALELMRIPYTGSGLLASSLAMDKIMTKKLWVHEGLPTPAWRVLDDASALDGLVAALGLPLIIKPALEGSTLGLTRVTRPDALVAAFERAQRYGGAVLAEQFLPGAELTVPLLGAGAQARALPVIEIRAPGGHYDYEHKYLSDDTRYLCPAPLDEALAREVMELARRAYVVLGCEGWGRADLMLDADGRPWLLEMNTSPGMTGHSLVPIAAAAAGMDYAELCMAILSEASCKIGSGVQGD